MPAIRSDSLCRSSPAPRMRVVPVATAAASARIGISSMAAATSVGETSTAWRSLERTMRSASGSPSAPPSAGRSRISIRAPMRPRMSMMARRVGFVLTPSRRSSASGWMEPATSQNAAADGSPGTMSSMARGVAGPVRVTTWRPRASVDSRTATPRARSIRSVWSRVATASVTVVSPSAARAASRIADFTWALGTGVSYAIGERRERPRTVNGRSVAPSRPENAAPIARNGSTTRPIGRRRSEASPSRITVSARPARSPATRRVVVPELPQSSGPVGWVSASPPGDRTR